MVVLLLPWAFLSNLFQLPILLGAIFLVNAPRGFFAGNIELMFSIAALLLLVFFFFLGSGPISADYYLRHHKDL